MYATQQLFSKDAANRGLNLLGFPAQDEQKDLKIGPVMPERIEKKRKEKGQKGHRQYRQVPKTSRCTPVTTRQQRSPPIRRPGGSAARQSVSVLVLHRWRSCRFEHAARFFVSRKAERAATRGVLVVAVAGWGVFPRETTGAPAVRSGMWQPCRSAGPLHRYTEVSDVLRFSFPRPSF